MILANDNQEGKLNYIELDEKIRKFFMKHSISIDYLSITDDGIVFFSNSHVNEFVLEIFVDSYNLKDYEFNFIESFLIDVNRIVSNLDGIPALETELVMV